MKFIILFLTLTSFLPAKTWIELAKEADYHADHPGRKIEEPEDDPKRLEFLRLNAQALKTIATGDPATFTGTALDSTNDWPGNFFLAKLHLSRLIKIQIKLQKWDEVDDLLKLAESLRKTIWASEPDLLWFLIARSSSLTTFQSLENLSTVKERSTRKKIFVKLKSHWIRNRILKKDFLLTEKGETRFAKTWANDIKGFLLLVSDNMDTPPLLFDQDFPHKLTVREILKLPLDADQFRKELLDEIKEDYGWIRGGKPLHHFPEKRKERVPRDLEFYRTHPNGLGEFLKDGMTSTAFPTLVHSATKTAQIQEVVWQWLSLEAGGTHVRNEEHIRKLLPITVRNFVETSKIKIDVHKRSITAPAEPLVELESELKEIVPNLFPN